MKITKEDNIGQLVADDYRMASVFQKHKIDFCCNGNRTIQEACIESDLNADNVVLDLDAILLDESNKNLDYDTWPIDFLAQYIEQKHHKYVETQIPILKGYLKKIISAHGNRHKELHDILELFESTASELALHMKKEELMLFPQVRKMVISHKESAEISEPPFGSFENPIGVMMKDHTDEGERFRQIRALSNDYTPPADGCNTYKVAFKLLEEFEKDLHLHIHLENNILFPKAIDLEKRKKLIL
ncbi:iron-sulfur cluster repair di-iron protein [Flavobacterium polysaccharolyticum]|uniref:Iron-sulfur cluster repair di-iron protein n=1 Tax=Flavobacterium polysaccharolyticum TaxID=3133148 RepID=A0ABU9NL98_9FLAO